MADTKTKKPEDEVEEAVEKAGKLWPLLWKAAAGLLVALLTWIGSYISKEYDKIKESNAAMEKRIEELEQDKAKWATLAALEEKQLEMRIQLEVLRQTWSYEYGRKVPTGFPERPGEPALKAPEELFRDVERYKAMQQQRTPPPPLPPSPSKK